jgi:hypothetical protein
VTSIERAARDRRIVQARERGETWPDGLPLSRCARPAGLALTFRGAGRHTTRLPSAPARQAEGRADAMTSTSARAEQIAAFYTRHADHLRRIVAAKVNAPAETIEDACQTASAALVRRDDVSLDHRGVKWLATVAIHEGWRLVSGTHDVPMGAIRAGLPTEGELTLAGSRGAQHRRAGARADRARAAKDASGDSHYRFRAPQGPMAAVSCGTSCGSAC